MACEEGLDLGAARDIPGTGIDVDDFSEKIEGTRAVGCRRLIDPVVPVWGGSRACPTSQGECHGNHARRQYRPHCPSLPSGCSAKRSHEAWGLSFLLEPVRLASTANRVVWDAY